MKNVRKLSRSVGLGLAGAVAAMPVWAQEVAVDVVEAPEIVATVDKGDVTWMMLSTILVLLMIAPGLALFYGGLVRAKNMLSVLMQVFVVASLMMVTWCIYGYSLALNGDGGPLAPFIGDFSRLFLAGVTPDSTVATFTEGVEIPEYVFIAFQMTFAAITPALIVGGFAERIRFPAVILFTLLWSTFVYLPVAHMVWHGDGYLFQLGALDFAGGTVVHINAGIAALVGAYVLGPRIGYRSEALPPHSLVMTMIGGSLLWVGWFGFNAGSNLEANGGTTLALINTFVATAGATLGWLLMEWSGKGKPSLLGVVSGAIAGLVAVTPAAGLIGPMGAIVLGAIGAIFAYYFCSTVKSALGYDDSLDVFGIHGVAGIIGSVGTGILVSPALGGVGLDGYSMGAQVWTQIVAVLITIVWCGVVSLILYKVVDAIVGLRVAPDREREGLDLAEHGERAYVM